jgi:hypothetical protein
MRLSWRSSNAIHASMPAMLQSRNANAARFREAVQRGRA